MLHSMLVSCPKVNHLGIKDTIHSFPQISYVSSNFTNAYIHRDIHHWTTIYKSKFKLLYIRKPCVNKPSLQNYMPLQRGLLCIPFEVSLLWSDSVYQIVPHLLTEEVWLRLRLTTTTMLVLLIISGTVTDTVSMKTFEGEIFLPCAVRLF